MTGAVAGLVTVASLLATPTGAGAGIIGESSPGALSHVVARNAWVIVPGVDSDHDGRFDRMRVRYLLPRDRPARVPAVVVPSPYWDGLNPLRNHEVDVPLYVPGEPDRRAAASSAGSFFSSAYERPLLGQGYAYVYAESLGSGQSTGCPSTGGENETAGMVAVVRWLAGRGRAVAADGSPVDARWSTGKVGMIGVSYNATLANAAAATGVRGLRAIVPVSGISSWYDYYRSQGAVRAPGGFQGEDADVLAKGVLTRDHPKRCRDEIHRVARRQERRTGDLNGFWRTRNYRPYAEQVRAAVLSLHGLSDFNVMSDQTGRWLRELERAGVPHQAWWHPRGHGDFLIDDRDHRWRDQIVDWFDRWLKGRHNGVLRRPGSVVASGDGYWTQRTWPAPGSARVRLWPGRGGNGAGPLRLSRGPNRTEHLIDDADYRLIQLARKGPARHRLLWQTAPLADEIALSGLGSVHVRATFDAPASNLSVGLVDIGPRHTTLVSEGWADPQNARSLTDGAALQPGRAYALDVALDQVLQRRVPAGHRLALVIGASDHAYTLRPPAGTTVGIQLDRTWLRLPIDGGRAALAAALG